MEALTHRDTVLQVSLTYETRPSDGVPSGPA
jgi:hypothetical protein